MKKSAKLLVILFLIVLTGALFSACSNNNIEGIWYEQNGYLRLDIADECTVYTYQLSAENPMSKDFEYKLVKDELLLINEGGKEVLLNVVFDANNKKIESIYYLEDDIKIEFTKDEKQPVSSEEVIIEAMTEAEEKMNEGDLNSMLELVSKGKETRALSNVIDSFLGKLNDY